MSAVKISLAIALGAALLVAAVLVTMGQVHHRQDVRCTRALAEIDWSHAYSSPTTLGNDCG